MNDRVKNLLSMLRKAVMPLPPDCEHLSLGEDFPENNFLIIQRRDRFAGIFSFVTTTAYLIAYAIEHGMIPVVDMRTPSNQYRGWFKPKSNPWELFFEQPCGYDLDAIKHAKNVLVIRSYKAIRLGLQLPNQGVSFLQDKGGELSYWQGVVQTYIRPQIEKLSLYRCPELDEAIATGKRVLAVLARGTDYAALRPGGHPVVPTADQVIADVQKLMDRYELIYLVTEDAGITSKFCEVFGARVILPKQPCVAYRGRGFLSKSLTLAERINQSYAYLKAILDIAKCSGFVSARTSGAVGALLFARGAFAYEYFYDLGNYP